MYREIITPRKNETEKIESLGFMFHQVDEKKYWDESACYVFNSSEISVLEKAAEDLYEKLIEAADWIISTNSLHLLKIPTQFHDYIRRSWNEDDLSIYGRFDFRYDGISAPKLYEFNADTPTSLFETSVVQWDWLQEVKPENGQFNSIHESLIESWREIAQHPKYKAPFYFTAIRDHLEDLSNTEYLRDTAIQADVETRFIYLEDIGWDHGKNIWVDIENNPIDTVFKLYPWEWLINDNFGLNILKNQTKWIEPAWKLVMSSKAILPILWEMFPGHPNLLPTYWEDNPQKLPFGRAKKPIFSREGSNVELKDQIIIAQTSGDYGEEGYIYQELCPLPDFPDDNGGHLVKPVVGIWMIGGIPSGLGIRETDVLITDNTSRFLPHYIL